MSLLFRSKALQIFQNSYINTFDSGTMESLPHTLLLILGNITHLPYWEYEYS